MKLEKRELKEQSLYGGMILLQSLLWGVGNPLSKLGMQTTPTFFFIAVRYILATLLFLLVFRKKAFLGLRKGNIVPCLLISFLMGGVFINTALAIKISESATTAAFLICLPVLFTPFFSRLFLHKKLNKEMWLIIVFEVLGVYLLCGGGKLVFGLGEVLALSTSLFFALTLVLSQKYIGSIGAATLSTMQTMVTAVAATIVSLIMYGPLPLSIIPPVGWATNLYLVLFSTFAAFLLQNHAIQHVSAVFSSLAYCTEPLFTAIVAYFLLDERLSGVGIIGAVIVVIGTVLAALDQGRKTE